jgi:hypothetical protein
MSILIEGGISIGGGISIEAGIIPPPSPAVTFGTPTIMNAGAFTSLLQPGSSAIDTAGLITAIGSNNGNFGSAASTILNNAALVQMYTDTRDNKDTITITKLTAEYPSQTVTGVVLDASKVYFSTGGKGNYTFTILKNGAKASDVNPIEPTKIDTTSAKTSADFFAILFN